MSMNVNRGGGGACHGCGMSINFLYFQIKYLRHWKGWVGKSLQPHLFPFKFCLLWPFLLQNIKSWGHPYGWCHGHGHGHGHGPGVGRDNSSEKGEYFGYEGHVANVNLQG